MSSADLAETPDPSLSVSAPESIQLGQSFTIAVDGTNHGGTGGEYSSISVSFRGYGASTAITGLTHDLDYGRTYAAGKNITHKNGSRIEADYLLAEAGKAGGATWAGGATHELDVTVEPDEIGTMEFYSRVTLTDPSSDALYTAPASSSYEDQQGYRVERHTVEVKPDLDMSLSAESGPHNPGDTVEFDVTITNNEAVSVDTWIDVSGQTPSGNWDLGQGTYINLDSGEQRTITLDWTVPDDAEPGTYQGGTAAYKTSGKDVKYAGANTPGSFEVREEHTLSVQDGSNGNVRLEPPGTTYSGAISKTYLNGESVTVDAQPADGYEFDYWSGDVPSGDADQRTLTLTMDSDTTLQPHFTQGEGSITVDVRHANGDQADNANALLVYQDRNWDEPYREIKNRPGVDLAKTISNLPAGHEYLVSAYVNDQSGGSTGWIDLTSGESVTRTISVADSVWVKPRVFYSDGSTPLEGARVVLKSHEGVSWRSNTTASDGYTEVGKLWTHPAKSGGNGYYTLEVHYDGQQVATKRIDTLESSREVTLVTSEPVEKHNLAVSLNASRGDVRLNPPDEVYDGKIDRQYKTGTSVTVTATPETGYVFDRWSGDVPAGSETDPTVSVDVDSSKSLTAQFTRGQGELEVTVRHEDNIPDWIPGESDAVASEVNALNVYDDSGSLVKQISTRTWSGESDGDLVDMPSSISLPAGDSYKVVAYINDQKAGNTSFISIDNGDSKSATISADTYVPYKPRVFYSDGETPIEGATVRVWSHEKQQIGDDDSAGPVVWRSAKTNVEGYSNVGNTNNQLYLYPTTESTSGFYYVEIEFNGKSIATNIVDDLETAKEQKIVTNISRPVTIVGRDLSTDTTITEVTRKNRIQNPDKYDSDIPVNVGRVSFPETEKYTRMSDTKKFPLSAIVQIKMEFGFKSSICSGTLIDDNHVLTAAHCIFNHTTQEWADSVSVRPGATVDETSEKYPFGKHSVKYVQTYKNWTESDQVGYDVAVLTLNKSVGNYTGTFGIASFDKSDPIYNKKIHTTGYPGEPPDGEKSTEEEKHEPYPTVWSQYKQIKGASTLLNDPFTLCKPRLCIVNEAETIGGQSGGPIWSNRLSGSPHIISVVSHTEAGLKNLTQDSLPELLETNSISPRITTGKFNDIEWMIRQSEGLYSVNDEPNIVFSGINDQSNGIKSEDSKQFNYYAEGTSQVTNISVQSRIINKGTDTSDCQFVRFKLKDGVTLGKDQICSVEPFNGNTVSIHNITIPDVQSGSYTVLAVLNKAQDRVPVGTLVIKEGTGPPQAKIDIDPAKMGVGEETVLDASESTDPDSADSELTYSWKVITSPAGATPETPDGASGSISLSEPGDYVYEVTVSDGNKQDTAQATVTVGKVNAPPKAELVSDPSRVRETDQTTLDAGDSTDPDDEDSQLTYSWTVLSEPSGANAPTPSGASGSVTLSTPGEYVYEVTVSDGDKRDTARTTVTVADSNAAPTAAAVANLTTVQTGDAVELDAGDSTDSDGTIATYEWDFDGDGTYEESTTTPTVTHTFDSAGSKLIRLRITDDGGKTDTATAEVTVTSPTNDLPTPRVDANRTTVSSGGVVEFDASDSVDPDGSVATYEWDFDGDGVTDAAGEVVTHAFDAPGDRSVRLTVTDDDGATNTTTIAVTVTSATNEPPRPELDANRTTVLPDGAVAFDASDSIDPDGSVATYEWDFDGDGVTDATGPTAIHRFARAGEYDVTLTVTDGDGATNTTVRTVTVMRAAVEPAGVDLSFAPVSRLTTSDAPGALDSVRLEARLVDANGTRIATEGVTVSFGRLSGGGAALAETTATTNASGVATVRVNATERTGETEFIARTESADGSARATTTTAGPVDALDLTVGDAQRPVGGSTTVAAVFRDGAGRIVPFADEVSLSTDVGQLNATTLTLAPGSGRVRASTTITASVAGMANVTAIATGVGLASEGSVEFGTAPDLAVTELSASVGPVGTNRTAALDVGFTVENVSTDSRIDTLDLRLDDPVSVANATFDVTDSAGEPIELIGGPRVTDDGETTEITLRVSPTDRNATTRLSVTGSLNVTVPEGAAASESRMAVAATDSAYGDANATDSVTFTRAGSERFEVTGLSPTDARVARGETLDVSATVMNTGDANGTQAVTLSVGDTAWRNASVSLGPGENKTVRFSGVDPSDLGIGTHAYGVATADDERTTTVSVTEAPEQSAVTVRLVPTSASTSVGGIVTYDVVVENVSGGVGSISFDVTVGNTTVGTVESVSVNDGFPSTFTTTELASNGSTVTVQVAGGDTTDTGAVTVGSVTLHGNAVGETTADLLVDGVGNENGSSYAIAGSQDANLTISPQRGVAVVGDAKSTDGDGAFAGDGRHQDVNGDGSVTFADVTTLFNQLQTSAVSDNVGLFDFNGDERITFADVTTLFNALV